MGAAACLTGAGDAAILTGDSTPNSALAIGALTSLVPRLLVCNNTKKTSVVNQDTRSFDNNYLIERTLSYEWIDYLWQSEAARVVALRERVLVYRTTGAVAV